MLIHILKSIFWFIELPIKIIWYFEDLVGYANHGTHHYLGWHTWRMLFYTFALPGIFGYSLYQGVLFSHVNQDIKFILGVLAFPLSWSLLLASRSLDKPHLG